MVYHIYAAVYIQSTIYGVPFGKIRLQQPTKGILYGIPFNYISRKEWEK